MLALPGVQSYQYGFAGRDKAKRVEFAARRPLSRVG
jgi:hypothetical protein